MAGGMAFRTNAQWVAARTECGSAPERMPFSAIGMPYSTQRSAQPGIAADRFAHEIVGFLKVIGSALAAPECQPVGRPPAFSFDMIRSRDYNVSTYSYERGV